MPYIREYTDLNPKELRQLKYKRQYKHEHPEWDDSMMMLTDRVRKLIVGKPVVLDFGCGRGNFVIDELAESFGRKIGFDVAQESVDGNVTCDEIVIGNETSLPFPDASIDVVISLWVFEHVEKPDDVMKEIARVLRPGGIFAFVTPNRNSLLIALRRILSDSIAHRVLKLLYGREEKDAFSVYYRANAVADILALAQRSLLSADICITNADPSYTSFNTATYIASKIALRLFGSWAKPHIVTVLRK